MKQSKIKADEMEMAINFKSMRAAYVFTEICLTIYCIYHFCTAGAFSVVTAIWLASVAVFFVFKLIYTHNIIRNENNEE